MAKRLTLGIVSTALAAMMACDIAYVYEGDPANFDGGGPARRDSASSDDSPSTEDAQADSGDGVAFRPVTIAVTSATAFPSGTAQQAHVVWADGAYWVFVLGGTKGERIELYRSTDFADFQPAGTVSLPFAVSDGRNLAVAARKIGSTDVLHVALAVRAGPSDRRHFHVRGTVSGGMAKFSSLVLIGSINGAEEPALDPDGPATLVLQSGQVLQASGYSYYDTTTGRGNAQVFRSGNDDGTNFDANFVQAKVEYTTGYINNRQLLQSQDQTAYFFYENATSDPTPDGVTAAFSAGGTGAWSKLPVFAKAAQPSNDWAAAVRGNDVDVVRRLADNQTFEHRHLNGGTFGAGAAMPKDPGKPGQGVVLLALGDGLTAYAIGSDDSIRASNFSGGAWSDWTSLTSTSATRTALSGYVSPADKRAALIWTEAGDGGLKVVGTRIPLPPQPRQPGESG